MGRHGARFAVWGLSAALASVGSHAQVPHGALASERTGIEIELHGSGTVPAGRPLALRGVAYAVTDLATLHVFPHAHVTARIDFGDESPRNLAPVSTEADADGRFVLTLPVPLIEAIAAHVRLDVGDAHGTRRFEEPLSILAPQQLELLTDRVLYEPGETMHVWARVLDRVSQTPVPARALELTVTSGAEGGEVLVHAQAVTSSMGLATFDVPLDADAGDGSLQVRVGSAEQAPSLAADTTVRVGRRTLERIMVRTAFEHDVVAPGEMVRATITVRAASGAPVRDATVELRHGQITLSRRTDAEGHVAFAWTAPVMEAGGFGSESVDIRAVHPAVGSARAHATYTVASVPFHVDLAAGHAGAIPEIDSPAYLMVTDPRGQPAPAGTPITASGRIVAHGSFRGVTDAHGLLSVPIHATLDAIAHHDDGSCAGQVAGTIAVEVNAHEAFATRLCVPVARDAQLRIEALASAIAPGEDLRVRVTRRAVVRSRAVVIDLLRENEQLASVVLPAGRDEATLHTPRDAVGVLRVRARPVIGNGTAEGTGSFDAVLARPAHAFELRLATERPIYRPRETARVIAETPPAGPRGAITLVVRDLAAHTGELPFVRVWLDGLLDRAVLSPATPEGDRVLRSAMAALLALDPTPPVADPLVGADGTVNTGRFQESSARVRGDLRDPFARRDDYLRRALVPVFHALETALEHATEGATHGIVMRRNGRAAFAPDVIGVLVQNGDIQREQARTLGDEPLTLAMIERADLGFEFDRMARRVARARLVRLLAALLTPVDPGADLPSPLASDTPDRWLSRLVAWGRITSGALTDPWGGTFTLRRATGEAHGISLGVRAVGWELASPGPDGVFGTRDDVRDPFERAVPAATPYAVASGEDELMRNLAALDPAEDSLTQMVAAYRRVGAGAHEEEIGDIVTARGSEGDAFGYGGLGLSGIGAGGGGSGTGTGYGSGAGRGGLGRTGGLGALAALLRERFPATLAFIAERAIDPSGHTVFDVPLADALTTFRVEAIAWTAEGWTSSARVDVRVDQDVVVDAPVPPIVAPGDVLRIPVRVSNRGDHAIRIRTAFVLEAGLDGHVDEGGILSLDPGAADETIVTLRAGHASSGTVRVTASDAASGAALDAVRRPMHVIDAARPDAATDDVLVDREGVLHVRVPRDGTYRSDGMVRVAVGTALGESPATWGPTSGDPAFAAWAQAMGGSAVAPVLRSAAMRAIGEVNAVRIARGVGALWGDDHESDAAMQVHLERITRGLVPGQDGMALDVLLGLLPAIEHPQTHPGLAGSFATLVRRLQREVERDTARLGDQPGRFALAAFVLRASAHEPSPRADEFLRRALAAVQTRDDESFLDGGPGSPDERVSNSSAVALALIAGGDRTAAFRFARGLARRDTLDHVRDPFAHALLHVLLARLTVAPPAGARATVTIAIDGHGEAVTLRDGAAHLASAALSRPGDHEIRVTLAAPAVLSASATARFGRPWNSALAARAPLEITLDGATGARDTRSALVMRIRNRGPRVLARSVVRIELPAGAELDGDARRDLSVRLAAAPVVEDRTLTLALRALAPGGTVRLPLRIRWTVAGTLHGLGVFARIDDTPDAPGAVLLPRTLTLDDRGNEPSSEPPR